MSARQLDPKTLVTSQEEAETKTKPEKILYALSQQSAECRSLNKVTNFQDFSPSNFIGLFPFCLSF